MLDRVMLQEITSKSIFCTLSHLVWQEGLSLPNSTLFGAAWGASHAFHRSVFTSRRGHRPLEALLVTALVPTIYYKEIPIRNLLLPMVPYAMFVALYQFIKMRFYGQRD